MSTILKHTVRWHNWGITVDSDILKRYAPSAHAAIEGGAELPEILDVDIAATLMKHQQERQNQWRDKPITVPTEDELL
jgi:hypothetical protein